MKIEIITENSELKVQAKFSKDKTLRFYLEKVWDPRKQKALFILLNPSKATSLKLDNTLCNIMNHCIDEDFGQLMLTNLFPFMATNQAELAGNLNKGKTENNEILKSSIKSADSIYIAWGVGDNYKKRKREIEQILYDSRAANIKCWFDKNNKHPMHLRIMGKDWILKPYKFKYI